MKRPLRHPKDPKGYALVRTNTNKGNSCSKCAFYRISDLRCMLMPCLSFMRPDGAHIHYVKTRKGKS